MYVCIFQLVMTDAKGGRKKERKEEGKKEGGKEEVHVYVQQWWLRKEKREEEAGKGPGLYMQQCRHLQSGARFPNSLIKNSLAEREYEIQSRNEKDKAKSRIHHERGK